MATETERKFLVNGNKFLGEAVGKIEITQSYLTVDPLKTVRIRVTGERAYLTIKSKRKADMLSRGEWEFEIPVHDAIDLMAICLPGRVVKTRYIIPRGKHKFEVDVFHDKNQGLVIAEIELENEEEEFDKPDWLGEEVTGNPGYYSSSLIK